MISARELSEVREEVHRWLVGRGATRRRRKYSVTNSETFESVCDEVLPANCAKEEWSTAAAIVLLDWTTGGDLLPSQVVPPDHPALAVIEAVGKTLRARLPPVQRAGTQDGEVRDLPRHLRANEMLVAALLGWRGESAALDRVGPYYAQWSHAAREVVRTISFVVLESQLQWLRATDDRLKFLETNLNFDQVVDVACDNFIGNVCDCALRVRNRANRGVRIEHCEGKHRLNSWNPMLARPSQPEGSDQTEVLDDMALLWNFAARAFSGRSSFYASHILASFPIDPAEQAHPLGQDGLPKRIVSGAPALTETRLGRQQRLYRRWTRFAAADFCRGMFFHEINRHNEALGFQKAAHFLCRTCRRWRTTACQRPDCSFDPNAQHPTDPLFPDPNVVALPIYICLEGASPRAAHFNKRHARWCHCRRLEHTNIEEQEGALARVLAPFHETAGATAKGGEGERKAQATPTLRPERQRECPFCKGSSGAPPPRPIWVPVDCIWFDAEPPGFDPDKFVSALPKEIAADIETTQNIVSDVQTLLEHWDDVEAELRAANNLPQNIKKVFKKFLSDPIRYWWVGLPIGLEKAPGLASDLIRARSDAKRDEWLAEWWQRGIPHAKLVFKKLNLSFKTMTL